MKRQVRGGGPMAIGAPSARTAGTRTAGAGTPGGDGEAGVDGVESRLRRRLGRADLRAVPEARRALRELLRDWGGRSSGRADVAELLTSELVTNALVHTDRDAVLTAVVGKRGLRVEVRDFAARPPRPCPADAGDGTHGRGLVLVQALADAWGVRVHGVGKAVWFELGVEG
ncbi:ATP-binding protein [Streptomyces sp. B93]|nr:ATP-binding protein [Streptomyces sp. B93]